MQAGLKTTRSTRRKKTGSSGRKFFRFADLPAHFIQDIIAHHFDAFCLIDKDGTIVSWSKNAEKISGWSSRNVLGKLLTDTVISSHAAAIHGGALKKMILEGKISRLKKQIGLNLLHKNGSELRVEASITPVTSKKTLLLFAVSFRPLQALNKKPTSKKSFKSSPDHLEETLRKSEARFRTIFDSSPLGMIVGTEAKLIEANAALCLMFGYRREEILTLTPIDFTHPDDITKDYSLFLELLAGKRDFYQIEKRYVRKDGSIFWGRLTVSLTHENKEGETRYSIAMVEDITESRQAIEAIKKVNIELKRLNEMKTEFSSMVTHELRTPLTVIKEGVAQVMDGLEGPVTGGQKDTLGMVTSNIIRLGRMIENVLYYAKIDSSTISSQNTLVDMNSLVVAIHQSMEPAAIRKGLQFTISLPSQSLYSLANRTQISHVLMNLVDNALKFTEVGKVKITLEKAGSRVRIRVQDTGMGIEKKERSKIFEVFGQAYHRGLWPIGGCGVGLAICKKLVMLHKGQISFKSIPHKGSIFTVSLKSHASPSTSRKQKINSASHLALH